MRKVYITATVKMILQVDEGKDIDEVMSEVGFTLPLRSMIGGSNASLEDASIDKFEITDSK